MVKKYIMNENLSWEERYKELEAHHIEETKHLNQQVGKWRRYFERLVDREPCKECGRLTLWEDRLCDDCGPTESVMLRERIEDLTKKLEEMKLMYPNW